MSNETNTPKKDDGTVAVQYINDQLQKSTDSLKRTRIAGVVVIVIVVAYMSFVTRGLMPYFEPTSAASFAKAAIAERVNGSAEDLSRQLREGVPNWLGQLPDFALKQIPIARQEIEASIEKTLNEHAKLTSSQIEKHLDLFLEASKDDIKTVLKDGQSLETVRHLGPHLEKEMLSYLKTREAGQESLQDKFDHALADLDKVAARVERLAKATDLTPEERRARRAIAVLLKKADWEGAQHEAMKAAK